MKQKRRERWRRGEAPCFRIYRQVVLSQLNSLFQQWQMMMAPINLIWVVANTHTPGDVSVCFSVRSMQPVRGKTVPVCYLVTCVLWDWERWSPQETRVYWDALYRLFSGPLWPHFLKPLPPEPQEPAPFMVSGDRRFQRFICKCIIFICLPIFILSFHMTEIFNS